MRGRAGSGLITYGLAAYNSAPAEPRYGTRTSEGRNCVQIAKLARDLLTMCPEPFSSWLKPITTSLAKH